METALQVSHLVLTSVMSRNTSWTLHSTLQELFTDNFISQTTISVNASYRVYSSSAHGTVDGGQDRIEIIHRHCLYRYSAGTESTLTFSAPILQLNHSLLYHHNVFHRFCFQCFCIGIATHYSYISIIIFLFVSLLLPSVRIHQSRISKEYLVCYVYFAIQLSGCGQALRSLVLWNLDQNLQMILVI